MDGVLSQADMLEATTTYEIQLDGMRAEMVAVQGQCRMLQAGTDFAEVCPEPDNVALRHSVFVERSFYCRKSAGELLNLL